MIDLSLPVLVEIGGRQYAVNTDYRDVLEVMDCLQDEQSAEQERVYTALSLFYDDFDAIPQDSWQEALAALVRFIGCGEDDDGRQHPKRMDWEQDRLLIIADINKAAGVEIRALPYMHWWTFISWFNSIGEGQLSAVCSIRDKRRKGKKLDEWEREYYAENRQRVEFKTRLNSEEQAVLDEFNKAMGGGVVG